MPINYIRLKNILKTYGSKVGNPPVIEIEDETIPLKGMIAIVGWSGSGKSTLLNILSIIDHPDPGKDGVVPTLEYHLDDVVYEVTYPNGSTKPKIRWQRDGQWQQMSESHFRREVFGYVFQEHFLHPNFNVRYNIKMPLFTRGKTMVDDHLTESCLSFSLQDQLEKQVNEISGGQAQRAAIIRGLMKRTPIVFGDELTSNIDQKLARQILEGLQKNLEPDNSGLHCFLWVSHDINLVKDYAHKILTIKNGKIKVEDNTFGNNPDGILALLKGEEEEIPEARQLKLLDERNAGPLDYLRYFFAYAYHDLFHRGGKPTTDFGVIVLSLMMVILFLFAILKLSYGSTKFLELKLSDPRINSMEIIATEKLGELNIKDYEYLKTEFEEEIRYITPTYNVNISLKYKDRKEFAAYSQAMTFRSNDPIVAGLLNNEDAPFLTGKDYRGLIVSKGALERFGYEPDTNALIASFNYNNDNPSELSFLEVDIPLPQEYKAMMREELYMEYFEKVPNEERPSMSCITLYPRDIYQSTSLRAHIEADGKYEVRDALKIQNKIDLIRELKRQSSVFVGLSLIAIITLSVLFVGITIYRNLYKKRKEMGVFLAYGMSRGTLFVFYLCEVAMIGLTTLLVSLAIYMGIINPLVDRILMRNGLLTITGTKDFGTQIDPQMLQIPIVWMGSIYAAVLALLTMVFLLTITYFSSMKPIKLMRDL